MKNVGSTANADEITQNEEEKAKKVRNRPLFHVKVSKTKSISTYGISAEHMYL